MSKKKQEIHWRMIKMCWYFCNARAIKRFRIPFIHLMHLNVVRATNIFKWRTHAYNWLFFLQLFIFFSGCLQSMQYTKIDINVGISNLSQLICGFLDV